MANHEQLVSAIRKASSARQERALKEQLWAEMSGLAWKTIVRWVRSREECEDTLHDMYIRFEIMVRQYNLGGPTPFSKYFCRCVKNRLIDRYRESNTVSFCSIFLPEEDSPSAKPIIDQLHCGHRGPHTLASSRDAVLAIERVFDNVLVGDEHRGKKIIAFKLKFCHDWPAHKVMKLFKIRSTATLYKWMYQVRDEVTCLLSVMSPKLVC